MKGIVSTILVTGGLGLGALLIPFDGHEAIQLGENVAPIERGNDGRVIYAAQPRYLATNLGRVRIFNKHVGQDSDGNWSSSSYVPGRFNHLFNEWTDPVVDINDKGHRRIYFQNDHGIWAYAPDAVKLTDEVFGKK